MTTQALRSEELQSIVRDHYSERAAAFDTEPTHGLKTQEQRQAWFEKVSEWITSAPGNPRRQVLDVGCATGFFALIAAELGHDARGIDISPGMIAVAAHKAARASLRVAFQTGDAAATGLPEASLDVILERHLLWTLPSPHSAVRHWLTLLRPGGRMVSASVDWRRDAALAPKGVYAPLLPLLPFYGGRSPPDMMALLTDAGFVHVTVEPLNDDVYWLDGKDQSARDRFAVSGFRADPS